MKTIIFTLLISLGLSAVGQINDLPRSLKEIPSLKHLSFPDTGDNQIFTPFHADSLSKYSFLIQKNLFAENRTKLEPVYKPYVEAQFNMPIVTLENNKDLGNMPVAVPDSTVDYYIKNSLIEMKLPVVTKK